MKYLDVGTRIKVKCKKQRIVEGTISKLFLGLERNQLDTIIFLTQFDDERILTENDYGCTAILLNDIENIEVLNTVNKNKY